MRADDGGAGVWNGKIHNLGSSGCMGHLGPVTAATNAGYAGAVSDGGHQAASPAGNRFDCAFGMNESTGALNIGLIRDFSAEHLLWQTWWSKQLTRTYYGRAAKRTYWSGCSQGGREAHIIAQTIPHEYDGVLGGGAGLWWMRFSLAHAWAGLVIKDVLAPIGKTLTAAHIAATTDAAIDACDMQDGIRDGVLADPRACKWSAKAAVCGSPGASADQCLDTDQADAYDLIRRGPRNRKGELIAFPFEPDSRLPINIDAFYTKQMMQWTLADPDFDPATHLYMDDAHLLAANDRLGITYEDLATLASQRVSDLIDASTPEALGWARAAGTKLLMWTGTADRNIPSRNTIAFYQRTAAYFGTSVSDPTLQSWYRVFLYPGVAHCGGGDGPWPGHPNYGPLFDALVQWVEHGVAPTQILATQHAGGSRAPGPPPTGAGLAVIATRPACAYPHTAIYKGAGSVTDAANFSCGGNLETPDVVEPMATPKFENGTGTVLPPYGRGGRR
ncbi:tannase/feruloyl esterase family alpha/beta hydrolase [Luteitalea pratensis]|uniref:tannase/feruloyl esterase family alpha/beta hydrolase n=1 Tax=Luteitalea pratensis TaxID=1855912 RepID=UPI0012FFCA82|nr:tannase/feruloyl esterase family alpha/beta hydrolase [Luteitalea pratensis]